MVPFSAIERIELRSSTNALETKHDTIECICARAQEAMIERTTMLAEALASSLKCAPQEP
jgi:hypothetical protein